MKSSGTAPERQDRRGARAGAGRRAAALLLGAALTSCGRPSGADAPAAAGTPGPAPAAAPAVAETVRPWFREEARSRGLVFDHVSGHARRHLLPEIMGSGCALFDMDADGDLDAYLVQSGGIETGAASRPPNRLFRNDGGRFTDVTEGSGADDRGFGMGVACGDYDADGDTDLYVTNVGPNVLLRNDGGGRFTDVTAAAGVGDPAWSTSAAFFDADSDGDLDLYVCNYVRWSVATERDCDAPRGGHDYCSPRSYGAPTPDTLYRNDGGGRFTDVSRAAGLHTAFGNGLGVAVGDVDGDGRPDVFVANDGTENQLWMQQGDGTFRDEALARGCAMDREGTAKAGMGVAAADFDDDGDLDVLVVNLTGEGDSLYRNEGGRFADRTAAHGLSSASRPFTRFGAAFADFDHDGRLDVFLANGRVSRPAAPPPGDPYAEPNQVLRCGADGRFTEVLPRGGTAGAAPVATSRGAAFGDVDGDGAIDVLVVNRDGPAHLFMNSAAAGSAWAVVRLVGASGSDALGARLRCRIGARTVTRDVRAAYSYCSSNDPRIHLGLGDETSVRDVVVTWPDGTEEAFGSLEPRRVHTLRRGGGGAPR